MDIATLLNRLTEKKYKNPITGKPNNAIQEAFRPFTVGPEVLIETLKGLGGQYIAKVKQAGSQNTPGNPNAKFVPENQTQKIGSGIHDFLAGMVEQQNAGINDAIDMGLRSAGRVLATSPAKLVVEQNVSKAIQNLKSAASRTQPGFANFEEIGNLTKSIPQQLSQNSNKTTTLANNTPKTILREARKKVDELMNIVVNGSKSPEDLIAKTTQVGEAALKSEDKVAVKALRERLNKARYDVTGVSGTGNYKTDFAQFQLAKQDPEIAPVVDHFDNLISKLDEKLGTSPKVAEETRLSEQLNLAQKESSIQQGLQATDAIKAQGDLKSVSQGDVTKLVKRIANSPADEAMERINKSLKTDMALPGGTEPLTPKQAVRAYKKTGTAYDFVNKLEPGEETIMLPAEGQALKLYDPKGKIASERSVVGQVPPIEGTSRKVSLRAQNGELVPSIDWTEVKMPKTLPEVRLGRDTMERNIEKIFGKQADKVKEFMIDPIKLNETNRANYVDAVRTETEKLTKKLGITKGSKADYFLQLYGEGKVSKSDLENIIPKQANNIVEAERYFRQVYDQALDTLNAQRKAWGLEEVPKRQNYFRHFQEVSTLSDIFGSNFTSRNIPPEIDGIVDFFKPGKPFTSVSLPRLGDKTSVSAIGGLDNYLDSASRSMFHTDSVQRIRTMENYVASGATVNDALPPLRKELLEYGNIVAGKKTGIDAAIEKRFGPAPLRILNTIKHRTSANMVGGNVSSALTNYIPFTQSIATTDPVAVAKGLGNSLMTPFMSRGELATIDGQVSKFLQRRYVKEVIQPDLLQKTSEFATKLFKNIDEFTARSVVAGKYYEGLQKGLVPEAAMTAADDYAAKLLADRSIGQLPTMMSQQMLGPITQFQTEVNNLTSFLTHDIPSMDAGKLKKISMLASYTVLAYLFNDVYQKVAGRRPTLDPLYATLTLTGNTEEGKNKDLAGRALEAGGQIAGNLPFVGGISGGRLPISSAVPNLVGVSAGKADLGTELKKPAYYLLPPFGGGQAKKTIEGLDAFNQGASISPTGRTKYEIDKSVPNLIKLGLFGKNSVKEAGDYYNNLGVSQSMREYNKMKKMTQAEAAAYAETLSPSVASEVERHYKDEAMKITQKERNIRNLPLKDRAREVVNELKKYKNDPERLQQTMSRWEELGILTDGLYNYFNK